MSIVSRIQNRIDSTVGSAIVINNTLDHVARNVYSGYRGLIIHQFNKFGYGSLSKPGSSGGVQYRVTE